MTLLFQRLLHAISAHGVEWWASVIAIVGAVGSALWWSLSFITGKTSRALAHWRIRRELEQPNEHELGVHDHTQRLQRMFRQIAWARVGYYKAFVRINTTARKHADYIGENNSVPIVLRWTARKISRDVRRLEASAQLYKESVQALNASYAAIFKSDIPGPKVVAAHELLKRRELNHQLREDVALLQKEQPASHGVSAHVYQLNREMTRYRGAVDAIIDSSKVLIALTETVTRSQS